jgi:hypothetical protein
MKALLRFASLLLILGVLAIPRTAHAVLITFDEFPDGTVVDTTGVTLRDLTLRYDGPFAVTGDYGPVEWGDLLLGDALGALYFDFQSPAHGLAFDFALDATVDVPEALLVELLDPNGDLIDAVVVASFVNPDTGLSEGHFSYDGPPYVSSATALFDIVDSTVFLVDNVAYYTPEPATLLLLGWGVAGVAIRRRRKGQIR